MQEDTESFNENSSSEVIILPQSNHLDETLISDDEDTDTESPISYEAKLNAKLKDLGLFEDGMTIQQKEELLTVVAVSFKTAEEEKSRRQWYEEYANAALNFPEDEIEFSFQQSPDSEQSEKATSYSSNYHINGVKSKGNTSSEFDRKIGLNPSTSVTRESSSLNDSHNLPSTSQTSSFKSKSQARRNRLRGDGNAFKLSLEEGNTVTLHSTDTSVGYKNAALSSNRQKKKLLEKSMSLWRPCLSPKDEPLIRISHPTPEELTESCSQSESPSQKRMLDYIQEFNYALAKAKRASRTPSHFGKPYHLTRSGHCLRKAVKVDSLDVMIGVQEGRTEVAGSSDPTLSLNPTPKKEPFSRTSGGAFSYVHSHRDRIDALRSSSTILNNHNTNLTNHTITRYSGPNSIDEYRTSPEILIEDDMLSDRYDTGALQHEDSLEQVQCEDVKTTSDTKLPKFSNLRPDLCRDEYSEKDILSRHLTLPYTSTGCTTVSCPEGSDKAAMSLYKKDNHIDSSVDGDLSDCSSVIDVETIVDDEIEEFVLKRKLLQDSTVTDKQTYSNRHKRLKKNRS